MRKRLGEMLVAAGLLSEQQLRVALQEQQRWGGSLGRTVVEMKLVGEHELVRVLADQLKVAVVDLDALEIPQSVLAWVTADLADLHALVPYAQPMKFLDVAMADPTNISVLDELRTRTKLNIRPALAGPKMIERAIGKYYGRGFSRFYGDIPLALDSDGPALEVEKSTNEPVLDDLLVEDRDPRVKLGAPVVVVPKSAPPPRPAPPPHPPKSPLPALATIASASSPAIATPPSPPPPVPRSAGSAELAGLERRLAELEARVAKQDAIIAKLVSALVEHGLGERADLVR